MMNIGKDHAVFIHYTLTDDNGELIDSSEGGEPLGYLHGHDQIIPGLEQELDGRQVGEEFDVTIDTEDAYGHRDEELISQVSSDLFEGVEQVEVGMQFRADSDQGQRLVTVTEVDDEAVTIDANHPLAGERLHFNVSITEVRPASDVELKHGHVHSGDSDH